MSHPLYNPYASGNQSSTQGQYGHSSIRPERDPRRASSHRGPGSSFSSSGASSAIPDNSGGMLPSLMSQSMSYRPEQSRAIMDEDVERSIDMHISRAREEVRLLGKPMHQPIDQDTRFTSTQRDEFRSSGTEMASYPMSSTSASLGHRHSDVESGSSSLDWSSNYKRPTADDSKFYSSSASSNYASGGEGRFNAPSEREHDMQSISGLAETVTESSRPKYTSESAANILLNFGLEKEDLEHLISYPEDQITCANLPFILRQICIQKSKRATTAVQSKPSKGLPTPTMIHDYAAASPRIFPHTCSLCNEECTHMKDWISHQNTSLHLESCKLLRKQYPDWDGEIALGPRSQSRSHSPRYDCPTSSRYRSRSRSPERRSSPRRRDEERSSPRRNDERRSSPRRSREKRSPPRRSDERRSSTEGSSPKRKKSSSAERLAKKLLETSAIQSLSEQSYLEALVKTLAPALLAELDKMKSSSSSSSSSSKGGKPSSSPPSAGGKRSSPTASSSSSSSTAKKKESTTEPSKAKPSLQKSEASSSTKTGTMMDNLSTNGTLETHGFADIDMANMVPTSQGASTSNVSPFSTCPGSGTGGGGGRGGIRPGDSPSGRRRLGPEEQGAVQSLSKQSYPEAVVKTLAPALLAELDEMKSSSSSSSSSSKGGKPSSSPPSAGGKRSSPTASSSSSSSTAKKKESTTEPSKAKPSLQKSEASSSTKTGTMTDNLSTNGTLETHGFAAEEQGGMSYEEPMELLSEIPGVPAQSNNPPHNPQPGPSGDPPQRLQLYGPKGYKLSIAQLSDPDAWAGIAYARPGWTPSYLPFLQLGRRYWELKVTSSIYFIRTPPESKSPKRVACGITCYDHPQGPWCDIQSLEGDRICTLAAPPHSIPPAPRQHQIPALMGHGQPGQNAREGVGRVARQRVHSAQAP